ncbi:MAG: hypothetical protein M3680_20755 [Myxococcota bacterium]|nr:hypothetical protein [Myxococcota bacterium]
MNDRIERAAAHLEYVTWCRDVLAASVRERDVTKRVATVVRPQRSGRRWWITLTLALAVAASACGGGKRRDTYARATDVQGACCEHLAGPAREQCLAEIVRVEDPQAAKTSTGQATYACVAEHFVCNPETGRPTQPSAQAQYDCIEDQAP